MRIVIAGQTYFPGNNGQAIFTIHLAEGLARAGHDVHVIVPNSRYRYQHEVVNQVNLHQVRALNFGWVHPEAYLGLLPTWQIARIFRENRPDVVHIQDHYFLSRDVLLQARRMGIPIVGTNHFLPENVLPYLNVIPLPRRWKISILWGLMLWTYHDLEQVTTPTRTAARILRSTGIHAPVTPVSCGVDTDHFHPLSEGMDRAAGCRAFGLDPEKVLFLYVGRLDREKRIDLLLQGLAQLVQAGRKDLFLAIAGQGAAKGELQALARSLHLESYVRFLGYVPKEQLPLLYQTGQIFVMPSPEELQSIATLEAMASGLPVLAAGARALPELVDTGVNGYLFRPNQVGDVAEGMRVLAEQRSEWKRMGSASRTRAMTHSLVNTIQRYEMVYRIAIGLERQPEKSATAITSVSGTK